MSGTHVTGEEKGNRLRKQHLSRHEGILVFGLIVAKSESGAGTGRDSQSYRSVVVRGMR